MSSVGAILKIYIEMNALLFVTWAVFACGRRAGGVFNLSVHQRGLTRVGQSILCLAMVLPGFFHFLPQQKISVARFDVFSSRGEATSALTSAPKTKRPQINAVIETPRYEPVESPRQRLLKIFDDPSPSAILMVLVAVLFAGWSVMALRLRHQLKSLTNFLSEATVLRKIGHVEIVLSDALTIPFSALVGRRAFVAIPLSMAFAPTDFRLAITHELQHHRRRDTAWARSIELFVCVFFWNPAIYFWKNEIIEVQELACDEALISQRRVSPQAYGSCLLKVAEAALGTHVMRVGTTCMAVVSKNPNRRTSFLRRRIDMFQSHKSAKHRTAFAIVFGTASLLLTAVVAYGAQQTFKSVDEPAPNPGHVSFDPAIQEMTEKTLAKYVKKFNAKAGFVLVSDPTTGRLLAMANISDDPKAKKNWALSYEVEPASAMKVPITAVALNEGVTTPDETHDCANGVLTIGHGTYHDWKPFTEPLTTADTIVNSSNLCGIRIAQELGAPGIAKAMQSFGFGLDGTTTGFPEARAGQIPDPANFDGDDYAAMIVMGAAAMKSGAVSRPGIHVTPLEVVQAFGAIANSGKLMTAIEASAPDSAIAMIRQPISEATANEMKAVLRRVVTNGTGVSARSMLYTTAGKTSSANGPSSTDHELTGGERGMGGFAGFAPLGHPRVAIYVGIIEPNEKEDRNPHGNRHAAPVFREVADEVLQHLGVPPDLNI